MEQRQKLTPCLVCGKVINYLWEDHSTNLWEACDVRISGCYGSDHDMSDFTAFICDECVDDLIKSNRVTRIRMEDFQ